MNKLLATVLATAAGLSFATASIAASNEAKAAYNAAKDGASADYKLARAKCDAQAGNPKDVCVAEAKAVRVRVDSEAMAQYKNTLKARTTAREDIAKADYAVAKAKCGGLSGNDKDVCLKQASAAKIAAIADAKADKKVVEARKDARDDKTDARYKVAMEKCDASSGPAKDACVSNVKLEFGK
jgi:hypothetical protein